MVDYWPPKWTYIVSQVEELRRQMTHLEKEHMNAVSLSTRLEEKLVSLLTCLDAKVGPRSKLLSMSLTSLDF